MIFTVLDPVVNRDWLESPAKETDHSGSGSGATHHQSTVNGHTLIHGHRIRIQGCPGSCHPSAQVFPMFMSAAGTIKPSRVLILGAGVAGLQAIAVARKLGAVVEVFDVRSAVKDEVKSLGAKFIEVEGAREDSAAGGYAVEQSEDFKMRQQELIQERAIAADVIIATAQIPGRRAPVLVLKETVSGMKPGSVIIDLAASSGGNCELTENGKTVVINGVTIAGRSEYPSSMSSDASRMFGNNVVNLLKIMTDKQGNVNPDFSDEIVAGTTAVHEGEYISPRVKQLLDIKQN